MHSLTTTLWVQASSLVSLSLTIVKCTYGYGTPISQLSASDAVQALKFNNFGVLLNGFSMVFLKVSIGATLLRLQFGRGMAWIVWGFVIISVLCNALVVVGSLFSCTPIEAIWDRSIDSFTCIPGKYVVGSSYCQTGT